MKATIFGMLPPLKIISPYCLRFLKAVSKETEVEFIGFKNLYPRNPDKGSDDIRIQNATVRNMLNWYDPFSWIRAGLTARGDVMHFQWCSFFTFYPAFMTALLASKARGKKSVLTIHDIVPHNTSKLKRLLNDFSIKFANVLGSDFIVHSGKNKDLLTSMFGINGGRIHVIPHGVTPLDSSETISKEDARSHLGISSDKKVILNFGAIRDYKGVDVLLKSFKQVSNAVPNSLLLIAGRPCKKGKDKGWADYEKIISENGLEGSVKASLGFIPESEIKNYFSASDLVVLPYTRFESQSGVGALALSYRKPLLVSDVGGLMDLVRNESAVVRAGDADDLSRKIVKIISDDDLLKSLSDDSEALSKQFDWSVIAKSTVELYDKLASEA